MSDVLIDQDTMEDIGDSIRSKLGVQTTYLPSEMPSAIMSISGGGGGGSAKYMEKELWSGIARPNPSTSYELNDSITNYDAILLKGALYSNGTVSGSTMNVTMFIPVGDISYGSDPTTGYTINGSVSSTQRRATICFTDSTHFLVTYVDSSENTNTGFLKVIGIKWETMQTALIYSEEEREVGVWTDGKPLYQKTYKINPSTLVPVSDWAVIDNTINGETLVWQEISVSSSVESRGLAIRTDNTDIVLRFCITDGAFKYFTSTNTFPFYNRNWWHITIRYTKTTDTPGSGIWTTTGEYAHHYSTSEHVIGTWIDGSTIYEKTFDFGSDINISYSSWTSSGISITNVDTITGCSGISSSGTYYPLMAYHSNDSINLLACRYGNYATPRYVTIQYTKTT